MSDKHLHHKPLKKSANPWTLFTFIFVIISFTLTARHCFPNPRIVQQSQHQYWRRVNLEPTRGIIQDSKGNALVISESLPSFAVDPSLLEDDDFQKLSSVLSPDLITKIHRAKDLKSRFMWIGRKVVGDEFEQLKEIRRTVRGVMIYPEQYRRYTNKKLMSHVLGFCNIDNRGLAGIEQYWDSALYNPPGQKLVVRRPGSQVASLVGQDLEQKSTLPVVTLTIDSRIQYVIEKHLYQAASTNGAKWAAAVCINPNTGEILSMASYPAYDASDRKDLQIESLSNSVISRGYEPGSTFKPIYLGIALERGWAKKDEIFFCPAKFKVADKFIRESYPVAMGNIDTAQLLIKSSNVGMAQIGIRTEASKIYDTLLSLGFGQPTNIELPGVAKGILPLPENWRGVTPANIAIGQGLAVTPLQLITAMAAIVNGGKLMSPYVVKEVTDSLGDVIYKGKPEVMREVLTPETTAWIRAAMRRVVLEGTGKRAATEVTDIAGKTGTAQVPEKGGYSLRRYVGSFIGFWPYEEPKYLMLIVIGEPTSGRIYGGELACPPFKRIVEEMAELEYFS